MYGTALLIIIGGLLFVYVGWQLDKKLTRQKANHLVEFKKRLAHEMLHTLQSTLGNNYQATFVSWKDVSIGHFDTDLQSVNAFSRLKFSDTEYFVNKVTGYYQIQRIFNDQPLRIWSIPYSTMTVVKQHVYVRYPILNTPLRIVLQPDNLPIEQGHQLESRSFNNRYTLWGDEQKLLTEVFEPNLMLMLQKFSYWKIHQLYIGKRWMQAEADLTFTESDIRSFIEVCERFIENYCRTIKTYSFKPKGE
jgi:hypothetical protein